MWMTIALPTTSATFSGVIVFRFVYATWRPCSPSSGQQEIWFVFSSNVSPPKGKIKRDNRRDNLGSWPCGPLFPRHCVGAYTIFFFSTCRTTIFPPSILTVTSETPRLFNPFWIASISFSVILTLRKVTTYFKCKNSRLVTSQPCHHLPFSRGRDIERNHGHCLLCKA